MKPIEEMTFEELCNEAAKHPGGDVLVRSRRARVDNASCSPCEINNSAMVIRAWLKGKPVSS